MGSASRKFVGRPEIQSEFDVSLQAEFLLFLEISLFALTTFSWLDETHPHHPKQPPSLKGDGSSMFIITKHPHSTTCSRGGPSNRGLYSPAKARGWNVTHMPAPSFTFPTTFSLAVFISFCTLIFFSPPFSFTSSLLASVKCGFESIRLCAPRNRAFVSHAAASLSSASVLSSANSWFLSFCCLPHFYFRFFNVW